MADINTTSQVIKSSLTEQEKQILLYQAQDFIKFFGDGSEGQKETPARMVKSWQELLIAEEPKITLFDSNGYDQMIIQTGIKYYTFCEHHFLPFFGEVKIGYIPQDKIIGLSKLSRIVNYFSKRLNTQEYFTKNIADYLQKQLNPKGVGVIVTGLHLCQVMRGAKSTGQMTTSELVGNFRNLEVRSEFLKL